MNKELPLDGHAHSQMAGFLCTTQKLWAVLSNLLEPGQVLARAPTATSTVVWQMDFVAVGVLARYSFIPESKEAIVCEFLAQGNYAIAHHHCDLDLQL